MLEEASLQLKHVEAFQFCNLKRFADELAYFGLHQRFLVAKIPATNMLLHQLQDVHNDQQHLPSAAWFCKDWAQKAIQKAVLGS